VRLLRPAAVVAALALGLTLAGCSTTTVHKNGDPSDVVNQGYVSGDGSTKTWPVSSRKGPVALAGTSYEGTKVDVAGWRGHVVVLNTWYANCSPCRAEAPDLAKIANDYTPKGVEFLGINATDDTGAAQAFQSHFAVPYPSIHDTDGSAIASLQGTVPVNAVPTTVFLDANGKVAARILGLADPSTVRTVVDSLLTEAGASPTGGATP
jgi:thiol-disulfide isomerase/thioredoxin